MRKSTESQLAIRNYLNRRDDDDRAPVSETHRSGTSARGLGLLGMFLEMAVRLFEAALPCSMTWSRSASAIISAAHV